MFMVGGMAWEASGTPAGARLEPRSRLSCFCTPPMPPPMAIFIRSPLEGGRPPMPKPFWVTALSQ